jgi:hypothetical protein
VVKIAVKTYTENAIFALQKVGVTQLVLLHCPAFHGVLQFKLVVSYGTLIHQGLEISEFTRGQLAELDNIDPIDGLKRLEVLYTNMDLTGEYLQKRFQSLNNYIDSLETRITKQLTPTSQNTEVNRRRFLASVLEDNPTAKRGGGCDDLDQDEDGVKDNCEEDLYAPIVNIPLFVPDRKVICDVELCLELNFQNESGVRNFLDSLLQPMDDCAEAEFVEMEILHNGGECHETLFEVTGLQTFPADSNCSKTVLRGSPITVNVGLDDIPPSISCGFLGDPSGTDHRISRDGKTLVVPDDNSTSFVNTNLFFDIQV